MLLNQNIDKLRTWLITVSSTIVGYSYSHNRLSCRHQYHQFCTYWQNLTLKNYRFPFNTSSLARFRDCGLLRLHLLVLSHALSCKLSARSYFRTIGYFASPKSHTLLLYFSIKHYSKICVYQGCSMNDEVYVWPFVPFEYDPVIAILLALLSANFRSFFLFFDLRKKLKSIKH